MIDPNLFVKGLKKEKIEFVSGVPDSLFKNLCFCFEKKFGSKHIIATNEGSAVSLGIGHYLAKQKPALIYMQNSGLGNIINPITSLAHSDVYGIPMILVIGWRGEILKNKQIQDEPQHKKQGKITLNQLKLLDIKYKLIDKNTQKIDLIIKKLKKLTLKKNRPVALVVRKNTFSNFNYKKNIKKQYNYKREDVIKEILKTINNNNVIISTTGMASRELFEIRKKKKENIYRDFLTVGGMGHASQIATGVAIAKPKKKIICVDGDGSVLMHMGSLAINSKCNNLIHILINNQAHDSVGGQPTAVDSIHFSKIAKACGYKYCKTVEKLKKISPEIKKALKSKENSIIIINCDKGFRKNLGRPDKDLYKRKKLFIKNINKR